MAKRVRVQELHTRRERVFAKMKKNSMGILFASTPKVRSNDTEYPYRQHSHFYYLSHFEEDSSCIVLLKSEKSNRSILFVHKKEKKQELWNGKRIGVDKAHKEYGFDEVYSMHELAKKLQEYAKNLGTLYYDFRQEEEFKKYLFSIKNSLKSLYNLSFIVGSLRLVKSKSEIKEIKKAIKITKEAHLLAMRKISSLSWEYELQAKIEYIFKKRTAMSDAYTSIVACGENANTLHYIKNNAKLKKGELVLIDAGCEYNYYASDITRSIPVNGRFSEAQKELYSLVLSVQKEIIRGIKEGVLRSSLHKKSEELLCKGMMNLGILKGELKELLKSKAHKEYYPHGIGHWMGIDVHDESPYEDKNAQEIPLQKGMVLTIEPGIYLSKEHTNIPKKYRGIGIRIEDNILVKKNGYKNLSKRIPKEIEDIERLCVRRDT